MSTHTVDVATSFPDTSAVAGAATSIPFSDFLAHTSRSGLTVIHQYEPDTLLAYAEQALMLEQKLVTGCYLLQAVLLVEYAMRTSSASPVDAQDFVRSFYLQRCRPQGRDGSFTCYQQDETAWRSRFAVQVHSVMPSPEFSNLQAVLLRTSLSTLRTLRRVWHSKHIGFFTKVLRCVESEQLSNATVVKCLHGLKEKRPSLEEVFESGQTDTWLEAFQQEIQRVRDGQFGRNTKRAALPSAEYESVPVASSSNSSATLQECLGHFARQTEPSSSTALTSEKVQILVDQGAADWMMDTVPIECDDYQQDENAEEAAADACDSSILMDSTATAHVEGDEGNEQLMAAASTLARQLQPRVSLMPRDKSGAQSINYDKAVTEGIQQLSPDDRDEPHVGNNEREEPAPIVSVQQATKSKTSKSKGKKRKRSHTDSIPPAAVTTAPVADIPCLPAMDGVPVQLVLLGTQTWIKCRNRQPTAMRPACDDTMADFLWHLADKVPEGVLLKIPELKQARRNTSREASAKFSKGLAGERQCAIIMQLLEHLNGTRKWV